MRGSQVIGRENRHPQQQNQQNLAAGYIEQSQLAITEIAYLLGFSDASNFTRAFRRWHGVSPRQYRVQRKIGES